MNLDVVIIISDLLLSFADTIWLFVFFCDVFIANEMRTYFRCDVDVRPTINVWSDDEDECAVLLDPNIICGEQAQSLTVTVLVSF